MPKNSTPRGVLLTITFVYPSFNLFDKFKINKCGKSARIFLMTVNYTSELHENITQICHRRGMQKKEVLAAVNINETKRDFTVTDLYKIASFLGLQIQELLQKNNL
ncbi:hypothetical protein BTO19_24070 [Vibrio parahaemolyticus]|nr:hypothetical protein BTO19_24070 [Vibrio parahaemolyticus]